MIGRASATTRGDIGDAKSTPASPASILARTEVRCSTPPSTVIRCGSQPAETSPAGTTLRTASVERPAASAPREACGSVVDPSWSEPFRGVFSTEN